VTPSSRSVSTKRETRSSTAAQLAIEKNLPEASKFDHSKKATPEEAFVLRDITSQANNEQVKRGRGRPRKALETKTIDVAMELPDQQEHRGEKSGEAGKKISEEQFISNFQSISSVMNNVDERDQLESQKVSEFSQKKEQQQLRSPRAISHPQM